DGSITDTVFDFRFGTYTRSSAPLTASLNLSGAMSEYRLWGSVTGGMPGTVSIFAGAPVVAVLVDPGSEVDVPAPVVVGAVRSSELPFPHAIATTAITVAAITRRRSGRRSGLRSKRCTVRAGSAEEVSDCPAMEGNERGTKQSRGRMLAAVGVVLGAALAVSPASWAATDTNDDAESAQTWSQVTDDDGKNTDEVAVVRTDDGVLHVLWRKRAA